MKQALLFLIVVASVVAIAAGAFFQGPSWLLCPTGLASYIMACRAHWLMP